MAEREQAGQVEQQARCSSSESDNFEKIESTDVADNNGEPKFIVGDEVVEEPDDEGPSHEGRDSFPNAPPPNIRRMLTPAQQLALAEKRSQLRYLRNGSSDLDEIWHRCIRDPQTILDK
ncbi:hypothetical protein RR48_06535 [Papilio machaon]|uniref:Uncharacterized protein n=1 Tax=Papilio machaon TaxID=76193 RepID=A0A194RQU1_PAPMA|nr:hypothetical protein RR48_06535 [Papilio machaon]